jgi:hypothetical protein
VNYKTRLARDCSALNMGRLTMIGSKKANTIYGNNFAPLVNYTISKKVKICTKPITLFIADSVVCGIAPAIAVKLVAEILCRFPTKSKNVIV